MFHRGDLKALAIIAGVAASLLALCLLTHLKGLIMRHLRLVAACAAAALALAGCGTTRELFRVNTEATPAVQKTQAESNAAFAKALAERLQYCTIIGNLDLIAKASIEAGLETGAGLNCPGRPWPTEPAVPLRDLGKP
jgi:predicted lipid-binding transport protein (Tim44 family)